MALIPVDLTNIKLSFLNKNIRRNYMIVTECYATRNGIEHKTTVLKFKSSFKTNEFKQIYEINVILTKYGYRPVLAKIFKEIAELNGDCFSIFIAGITPHLGKNYLLIKQIN